MEKKQIEKLTESKPRYECELWVEEYFGLSPLIEETDIIDTDYGHLVNLCAMVKDKVLNQLASAPSPVEGETLEADKIKDGIDAIIKTIEERENAFIKAWNILHDEDIQKLTPDLLAEDDFEDEMDLCELYYQIRTGKLKG